MVDVCIVKRAFSFIENMKERVLPDLWNLGTLYTDIEKFCQSLTGSLVVSKNLEVI